MENFNNVEIAKENFNQNETAISNPVEVKPSLVFTKGNFGENTFTGTAKQFVESSVKVNGKCLTQMELSVLKGLGIAHETGKVNRPKGQKGKKEVIYSITCSKNVKITF
ncbi:MAG: hypothetical protein ACRCVT_07700 [Leadbetterella sp.]